MSRRLIQAGASRSGASAVEFALVLFPLLLVIFGVIEFGRAMWTREALQETAIAGARCMGVLNSNCATGARLQRLRHDGLRPDRRTRLGHRPAGHEREPGPQRHLRRGLRLFVGVAHLHVPAGDARAARVIERGRAAHCDRLLSEQFLTPSGPLKAPYPAACAARACLRM